MKEATLDDAAIPLHVFVRGDVLGLVLVVASSAQISDLAAGARTAAACRVPPTGRSSVWYAGVRLDPQLTIAQAGLRPLTRVDVVPEVDP